jgi:CHORD
MKVMLHYEDHENVEWHKTLKITLPKSWKTGPTSQLLEQFIEAYNPKFPDNVLDVANCHLSQRRKPLGSSSSDTKTVLVPLASNAIVVDDIPDRGDVYICHGPSETKEVMEERIKAALAAQQATLATTVACTHFGCRNRFPKGGPYPVCIHHKSPPVFHETAKYWACCPDKKAYDWEDFQTIPGCQTGFCTDVKEEGGMGAKQFWGGSEVREQIHGAATAPKLKSIDDFNKTLASGGSEAAPVLDRVQSVLEELGIEAELYHQVVNGIKKELKSVQGASHNESELLSLVALELGKTFKSSLKAVAAEQLRIK